MSKNPFNLTKGERVKGIIKSVTEFGVFVDVDGFEGLLSACDVSWGSRPPDLLKMFQEGQEIHACILAVDEEGRRLSLSLRELYEDPWKRISKKYKVNQKVKGRVNEFQAYGAFVQLEPGVEGLVPLQEISWTLYYFKPSDALQNDQEVEAKVTNIDKVKKIIHLSMRQLQINPWGEIYRRYPPGKIVKATVRHVFAEGAYLDVEGIHGVIQVPGATWSRPGPAHEILKKGDFVEAEVLSVDKEKYRICLGLPT